jgi:hypothetical protein
VHLLECKLMAAIGLEKQSPVSHMACVDWLHLVYLFNAVSKIYTVE